MPKILIVTGDAAESLEVLYPYQRLLEEGYEVDIAAPTRKRLQFVIHDGADGFDTYTEKSGYSWSADLALQDVEPSHYAGLVLPGGRAPEYLRNDPHARRVIAGFAASKKPIAHICHGALLLATSGILAGRRTTGYPAIESDIWACGATYVNEATVVDGNIVGARTWADQPTWMRAFIQLLRQVAPPGPVMEPLFINEHAHAGHW